MTSTAQRIVLMAVMLGLGVAGSGAKAGILIDQSPPGESAFTSDIALPHVVADNFTLWSAAAPDSITYWGAYFPGNTPLSPDLFSLAFYDDSGGLPGALITSIVISPSRFASGGSIFANSDIYEYTANFAAVHLTAGSYWLSVVNDSSASPSNQWVWGKSTTPADGIVAVSEEASRTPTTWAPNTTGDMAFRLSESTAAVPEPSTLVSAGIAGLVGLGALWRKRRKEMFRKRT